MTFHVGMKVVCVLGFKKQQYYNEVVPILNEIYTVRNIINFDEKCGLHFYEIVNAPNRYSNGLNEVAFDTRAFRPLVSQKDSRQTDISIFTKMLRTKETV